MIKHECEKCKYLVKNDICFCDSCFEEEMKNSYDEGYEVAKKEYEKVEL